eukprot:jgi/Picre1/29140/NNA_004533.t1
MESIGEKDWGSVGHVSLVGVCSCLEVCRMLGWKVNKPELLPPGPVTPVIDGVKLEFLHRIIQIRQVLPSKSTGVDDDTVVFVADPNTGNILNFNVGTNVDFRVPRSFWSKLSGRFGNKFYWTDNGEDVAIVNAVAAIDNCLREPMGRLQCNTIRGELE